LGHPRRLEWRLESGCMKRQLHKLYVALESMGVEAALER
jgi:hypothetical protein